MEFGSNSHADGGTGDDCPDVDECAESDHVSHYPERGKCCVHAHALDPDLARHFS
jgi:hypothetical protein